MFRKHEAWAFSTPHPPPLTSSVSLSHLLTQATEKSRVPSSRSVPAPGLSVLRCAVSCRTAAVSHGPSPLAAEFFTLNWPLPPRVPLASSFWAEKCPGGVLPTLPAKLSERGPSRPPWHRAARPLPQADVGNVARPTARLVTVSETRDGLCVQEHRLSSQVKHPARNSKNLDKTLKLSF